MLDLTDGLLMHNERKWKTAIVVSLARGGDGEYGMCGKKWR